MLVLSLRKLDEAVGRFIEEAVVEGCRILVTDAETIRLLRVSNMLGSMRHLEIVVFNRGNPEEESLRIIAVYTPSEAYICDQRGSLNPLSRVLRKLGIPVKVCEDEHPRGSDM
ncbi:hypothetical protein [Desulfurococcus mucosus]|uniref:Uncharacterized protein n=1 Tax=Desulfurococcus mucosus (strain ATCC 35584 / DSM 2162 / JCM 9187 / O7/1) TaxID=765177 RepID=E8R738_DESM0|nr:hypothetical protein [Desulfurococcus mucosus]ADV64471.1 hypothetical protein Desmu_0152 [Desulfurococcus mucosus DSM 2162]